MRSHFILIPSHFGVWMSPDKAIHPTNEAIYRITTVFTILDTLYLRNPSDFLTIGYLILGIVSPLNPHDVRAIFFVGGARPDGELSEAQLEMLWAEEEYSDYFCHLPNREVRAVAVGNSTAENFAAATDEIVKILGSNDPGKTNIHVVGHPDHTEMIAFIIKKRLETHEFWGKLEIIQYRSGEKAPYSPLEKAILWYGLRKDPFWEGKCTTTKLLRWWTHFQRHRKGR
ncbi:hypothetical protein HY844_02365 [Candidatus Berkelbacteria bacterium]|nr:hypothetical protein [Candidatus Berkelbacteria bacterium]